MATARRLLRVGLGLALAAAMVLALRAHPPGRWDPRREKESIARRRGEMAKLDAELRDLQAENERQDAEIRRLEALLSEEERVRAWYAAQAARARLATNEPGAIPGAVLDAAAAARVPEEALRIAFDAARDPTEWSLARLREAGVAGFRGLVAILHGGGEIADVGALFAASWDPEMAGEESALIAAAESDVDVAVVALGYCDTPRTRDYLIARLRRGQADSSCAEALGRLREPRAVPYLAHAIREIRAASDPLVRTAAISALGDIGGDAAREALREYLRDPGSELVVEAASALHRIDPGLARREVEALLAGPRDARLTESQRRALRGYAK